MRLINLNTLKLREFVDAERPPYVILSHTWGAEEVSLQEFGNPTAQSKSGYLKILAFASEGRKNGFEWGWVDTCCIDKTSSAELSEAINSMYRYYAEADSCYAYLSDVGQPENVDKHWPLINSVDNQFASSRWFTRGWTLQELIAPSSVVFYRQDWTVYGTKSSLHKEISSITGIPVRLTTQPGSLHDFTVAQKISWASKRQTTRPEDLSYCLLGILGVYMPLLYGEGTRAFRRLQEEFMKIGSDPTLFSWSPTNVSEFETTEHWDEHVPLAPCPAAFQEAGEYRTIRPLRYGPWSMTNVGMRVEGLPIVEGIEADVLLVSAKIRCAPNRLYVVALIGCGKGNFQNSSDWSSFEQLGIVLYSRGKSEVYYRPYGKSLLLLNSNIIASKSVNCILKLERKPFESQVSSFPFTWTIRDLPDIRFGFGMNKEDHNESFSKIRRYGLVDTQSTDFQIIAFSNQATKEEFFVVVRAYRPLPWISVRTNTTIHKLRKEFTLSRGGYALPSPFSYLDYSSVVLQGGRKATAIVVPGMKNGKRVFFLDLCIQETT